MTAPTDPPADRSDDPASGGLARGLDPDARFRCDQCGNVTRFDVVAHERTRRYLHFDLGGARAVDEEEILERTVESVTCHWCGRADAVRVEAAPAGDPVAGS